MKPYERGGVGEIPMIYLDTWVFLLPKVQLRKS